ncbi:MAG: tRNA (adenosine(37)-N6)-threonylcarbamoyltransferase complex transferase subunit TsaD, partial [Nitrospirota bacterium]|nr:tRNA (adenosine(37)-N6)-threonylcarbamoyltransferase complex transferase subunit TsaD [Nitrospirota bacterium]
SLHVGCSFAKSLSLALGVPLIAVQHMQAHVLAHFIENEQGMYPEFPFICLTISGGHTQLVYVRSPLHMEIIGETLDDAAGEAFDKAAKLLGLSYPGGPEVDKLAKLGDPQRFQFPHPKVPGLDYSFSGLKTSLLYLVRDELAKNKDFIENHRNDICASFQKAVVQYTLQGLTLALKQFKVKDLSLAGGVSANSAMRAHFRELCDRFEVNAFIPPMAYCTDNAAMIGIVGYYKYQQGLFADLSSSPKARMAWDKN